MTEGLGTPGTTPDPIGTTGGSGATAPTAGVGTTPTRWGPEHQGHRQGARRAASPTRASRAASTSQRSARTRPSRSPREAGYQAKALLGQAQSELVDHASSQQNRIADQLHSLSHELGTMASKSDEEGLAKDLAQQASQQIGSVAHWLQEREPGDLHHRGEGLRPSQAGHVPRGRGRPRPPRRPDDARRQGGRARPGRPHHGRGRDHPRAPGRRHAGVVGDLPRHGVRRGPSRTGDAQPDGTAPAATSVTRPSASRSRPTSRRPGRRGELGLPARAGAHERPEHGGSLSSVGQLLGEISGDISTLMRQEVELAKSEIRQSVSKASKGSGMLAGAAVGGHMVLLFLSIALWWGLGNAIGRGWSALVVAVIWAIIAAILASMGGPSSRRCRVCPRPPTRPRRSQMRSKEMRTVDDATTLSRSKPTSRRLVPSSAGTWTPWPRRSARPTSCSARRTR